MFTALVCNCVPQKMPFEIAILRKLSLCSSYIAKMGFKVSALEFSVLVSLVRRVGLRAARCLQCAVRACTHCTVVGNDCVISISVHGEYFDPILNLLQDFFFSSCNLCHFSSMKL